MDALAFRRILSARASEVKAVLFGRNGAPTALPELQDWSHTLASRARDAVDFGHIVTLDALVEDVLAAYRKLGKATFSSLPRDVLLLRCFQAHAASARRYKLEEQAEFFRSCKETNDPCLKAHGFSGGGFLSLISGDFGAAESAFSEASEWFHIGASPVDALKVDVRRSMVLRITGRQRESLNFLERCAARARALGADAWSPLVSILATLGLDNVDQGSTAAGLRTLREAVKLANLVPKCQASLYAFSQYGNGLLRTGRCGEAVVWLEKVEGLQRVLEPTAQVTTQVLLFDAFISLRRFDSASRLANELLRHRMLGVDPDLRDEVFFHLVRLRLALGDLEGARALVGPLDTSDTSDTSDTRESHGHPSAILCDPNLREKAMKLLADAPVFRELNPQSPAAFQQPALHNTFPSQRICVNFTEGEAIVSKNGVLKSFAFARASALRAALLALLQDFESGGGGIPFGDLAPGPHATPLAKERAAYRTFETLKESGMLDERVLPTTKRGLNRAKLRLDPSLAMFLAGERLPRTESVAPTAQEQ